MSTIEKHDRQEPQKIDFGQSMAGVRLGPMAVHWSVRSMVVCGILIALTVVIALWALATGDYTLDISEVLGVLTGAEDGLARTVVMEWRAPRVVGAILFGAALGFSGGIFQSLTRNPLASPDIIGFSAGSYTGALVVILVIGGSFAVVAAGALVGGVVTAVIVYLLAYSRGVKGFRLIVVGIAISSMLGSVNTWLMMRADQEVALVAAVWGAGSLNGTSWNNVLVGGIAVLILSAGVLWFSRALRQMEMGDDAAKATGVHVEPVRLALIFIGVALTAVVTASAGPISFVALAAPQIARRLTRSAGIALVPAAVMGAFLLLLADVVAQNLLPTALPVGVVTVVVGGGYLVWLLIHEARNKKKR